jgi:hypothetical protein
MMSNRGRSLRPMETYGRPAAVCCSLIEIRLIPSLPAPGRCPESLRLPCRRDTIFEELTGNACRLLPPTDVLTERSVLYISEGRTFRAEELLGFSLVLFPAACRVDAARTVTPINSSG